MIRLMLCFFCFWGLPFAKGQDDFASDFAPYTTKDAVHHFQMAQRMEQNDSIQWAITYYTYVAEFDSLSDIGRLSSQKVQTAWLEASARFEEQFKGTWRWIWTGDNWGTASTPSRCSCEKTYVVTEHQIQIFQADTLVMTRHFELVKNPAFAMLGSMQIRIKEDSAIWRVTVTDNLNSACFFGESSKKAQQFINIMTQYGCVCGCNQICLERLD